MTTAPAVFQCPACRRRFRWQPSLAGRKVQCPCGQILTAPAAEPIQPDDDYDLAPAPQEKPKPQSRRAPDQPHSKAAPTLAYRTPTKVDPSLPDKVTDFQAPLVLLIAGIAIESLSAALAAPHAIPPISVPVAIAEIGMVLIVKTAILVSALFIAAKFRQIDFGRFPVALFKLAAIAIAPSAFATFIGFFLQVLPLSGLITAALTFIFYFTLIGFLFDLDQSDTWYCVCVVFLLNLAIYFASSILLDI